MPRFNEEQLAELETVFQLKRAETLPVRDGRVTSNTLVWWRGDTGPELVTAARHWENIREFPNVYQLTKPRLMTKVTYLD